MNVSTWKERGGTYPELRGYNIEIYTSRDGRTVRIHVTSTKMAGGLASVFVDEQLPDPATDPDGEEENRVIQATAIAARDFLIADGGAFAGWRHMAEG